jgi:DNA-binding NarL/FixJ family response regulator
MKPKILIADDHEMVRQGLRRVISEADRWDIVGEAVDGRQAVELAQKTRPDVVVIDYSMPNLNGLEATRQIRAALPSTEVLILTMHDSESLVREVLSAGAKGYLLKSDAGRVLLQGIETLLQHRPYFSPTISELLLNAYLAEANEEAREPSTVLTAREREVVQLLAEGRSTKEAADLLSLSIKTVETHRANVMRKLGLQSFAELVRYAIRNNIITP